MRWTPKIVGLLALLPTKVCAQASTTLTVSTFALGDVEWKDIVKSVLEVATVTIYSVATVTFVAGAGFMIISGGDEGRRSKGKSMMIGAVIAVAVVLGAKGILNTIMFFIYG